MPDKTSKRFSFRSIVAMLLMICVIGLAVTALGMDDDGGERVANAVLDHESLWKEIHGLFGITLVAASLCHIYLNRRPMMNHFKKALGR